MEKKGFILKNFFAEKNFFYREKYKRKSKKYISHVKSIFLYRKCLFYKQNINLSQIYIHSAKNFFSIIKNISVNTSLGT